MSLVISGSVAWAEVSEPLPPRQAFLGKATIQTLALSPSGRQLAYVQRDDKTQALWLMETDNLTSKRALVTQSVESIAWATDESGIFIETGQRLAFLDTQKGTSRLIWRLDPDKAQRWVGVDPTRPHHFWVHQDEADGQYTLLTVDKTGAVAPLLTHPQRLNHISLDASGQVAFLKYIEGDKQVIRAQPQGLEWLTCDKFDPCHLLGPGPGGEGFYLKARLGEDLLGFYLVTQPGVKPTLLHRDPEGAADLARVYKPEQGAVPILLRYDTPRPRTYALDTESQAHVAAIETALNQNNITLAPRAAGPWLVTEFGPKLQHPRYHLYDPKTGHLRVILDKERGAGLTLNSASLVDKTPVQYTATDGMILHGYVSLPKVEDLTQAPVVIQVHGGPWSQTRHSFDSLTQFLVSRGYIVWAPNFRASKGYGQAYLEAGRGEFGQGRVEEDLFDGLDALTQKGWGDAHNVAMIGHSFGGFATLSAVATQGDRIKVGIASAPPIDLLRALDGLDDDALYTSGMPMRNIALDLVLPKGVPNPRAEVKARSPEALLAQTSSPLLILAGAQDAKVNIVDVQHYALALDALGKDISLLVDPLAGHSFEDESLRQSWLYLAEALLGRYLGGAVDEVEAPIPGLKAYLKRTLVIEGESLRSLNQGSASSP